ncbi:MAG: hypothetical protein Q8O03_00915 [Nanoarchaeota archaeon]|nr:hypothetical protein [Nanoarchaeota archaeon]
MIRKIITKKSIVFVFVFVLFCSFSVAGYILEDETYSEKVIADSLAFEKDAIEEELMAIER